MDFLLLFDRSPWDERLAHTSSRGLTFCASIAGQRTCANQVPGGGREEGAVPCGPGAGLSKRLARALGLDSYINIAEVGSPRSSPLHPQPKKRKRGRNLKKKKKIPVRSFQCERRRRSDKVDFSGGGAAPEERGAAYRRAARPAASGALSPPPARHLGELRATAAAALATGRALRGAARLCAGPGGAGAAPPPLGSSRRSRMLRSAPAAGEGRKVWGRLRAAGAAEEKAEARFPRLIGKEG